MSNRTLTIVNEPILGILFCLLALLLAISLKYGLVGLRRLERPRPLPVVEQRLEGALRAGSPEFDEYRERIVIGQPEVVAARRAAGDPALELAAMVRNETGRVIKGLEVSGSVIDSHGSLLEEMVAVIIPTQQTAIEPNEAIKARLLLKGIGPETARAGVRMEATGVIFD